MGGCRIRRCERVFVHAPCKVKPYLAQDCDIPHELLRFFLNCRLGPWPNLHAVPQDFDIPRELLHLT